MAARARLRFAESFWETQLPAGEYIIDPYTSGKKEK